MKKVPSTKGYWGKEFKPELLNFPEGVNRKMALSSMSKLYFTLTNTYVGDKGLYDKVASYDEKYHTDFDMSAADLTKQTSGLYEKIEANVKTRESAYKTYRRELEASGVKEFGDHRVGNMYGIPIKLVFEYKRNYLGNFEHFNPPEQQR